MRWDSRASADQNLATVAATSGENPDSVGAEGLLQSIDQSVDERVIVVASGPVAWMARLEPRCAAVVAVLGRPLGARGACKSRRCRATSSISRISTASGSAPPPIWLCPRPKPQCKVALAKPPPFSPAFFSREIIFTQNKSTGSPVQQLLLEGERSCCFQINSHAHARSRSTGK